MKPLFELARGLFSFSNWFRTVETIVFPSTGPSLIMSLWPRVRGSLEAIWCSGLQHRYYCPPACRPCLWSGSLSPGGRLASVSQSPLALLRNTSQQIIICRLGIKSGLALGWDLAWGLWDPSATALFFSPISYMGVQVRHISPVWIQLSQRSKQRRKNWLWNDPVSVTRAAAYFLFRFQQ